jgi:hypothetical protein
MAGRGTDIVLGPGVADMGGLHIVGTERHEARRVDNQLRAAAQGLIAHAVHVAYDHVRLETHLDERVRAAVNADQHGLYVADIRPDDPQVFLVGLTSHDNERVAIVYERPYLGQIRRIEQQRLFLCDVAQRVLGEPLKLAAEVALGLLDGAIHAALGQKVAGRDLDAVPAYRAA